MRVKLDLLEVPATGAPHLLRWSVSLQQQDGSWVSSSGTSAIDDGDLVHRQVLKAMSQVIGSADHS